MRVVWLVLLVVTSLVSGFFLLKTADLLSLYFSLNKETNAISTRWSVSEKGPSSFALRVFYEFDPMKKIPFHGTVDLVKPYFLNAPSAQSALEVFAQKSWIVFYNEKNPSISSLQKIFPFKECFHFLLSLGVFVYFLFFRKILKRSGV
jgi:hypothetical protein